MSRRTLLGSTVALGAVAAASAADQPSSGEPAVNPPQARRSMAEKLRVDAARSFNGKPVASHPTNGDEATFTSGGKPTYIGNYSKGMPHNDFGEVDPDAYGKLLDALAKGDNSLFEAIP